MVVVLLVRRLPSGAWGRKCKQVTLTTDTGHIAAPRGRPTHPFMGPLSPLACPRKLAVQAHHIPADSPSPPASVLPLEVAEHHLIVGDGHRFLWPHATEMDVCDAVLPLEQAVRCVDGNELPHRQQKSWLAGRDISRGQLRRFRGILGQQDLQRTASILPGRRRLCMQQACHEGPRGQQGQPTHQGAPSFHGQLPSLSTGPGFTEKNTGITGHAAQ